MRRHRAYQAGRLLVPLVVPLLLAVVLLGACSDPAVPDGDGSDGEPAWRTSTDPVATGGLVWAADAVVHLADQTTIDTGEAVAAYAVAGDGVFFVPLRDEESDPDSGKGPLLFAAPDQGAVETGLRVRRDGFAVSPDGQKLVVLDANYDDGSGMMRIFDLSSGEVATSQDGWDDSGFEDPVRNLLESEVQIEGVTDSEVYARTIEGDWVYDLTSGEGRPVEGADESPWGSDPMVSPEGTWRIVQQKSWKDFVVSAQTRLVPRVEAPHWTLSSWIDRDTVRGAAVQGTPQEQGGVQPGSVTLMTCEVPSGTCQLFPETTGKQTVAPISTGYVHAAEPMVKSRD